MNSACRKKNGTWNDWATPLIFKQCISDGLSNREIAAKLFLSEGTVKNYISSVYAKLDVRDRMQASLKAREEGMI